MPVGEFYSISNCRIKRVQAQLNEALIGTLGPPKWGPIGYSLVSLVVNPARYHGSNNDTGEEKRGRCRRNQGCICQIFTRGGQIFDWLTDRATIAGMKVAKLVQGTME